MPERRTSSQAGLRPGDSSRAITRSWTAHDQPALPLTVLSSRFLSDARGRFLNASEVPILSREFARGQGGVGILTIRVAPVGPNGPHPRAPASARSIEASISWACGSSEQGLRGASGRSVGAPSGSRLRTGNGRDHLVPGSSVAEGGPALRPTSLSRVGRCSSWPAPSPLLRSSSLRVVRSNCVILPQLVRCGGPSAWTAPVFLGCSRWRRAWWRWRWAWPRSCSAAGRWGSLRPPPSRSSRCWRPDSFAGRRRRVAASGSTRVAAPGSMS